VGGDRAVAAAVLVRKVRVIAEAIDELDREVSVDSSIVRAHQHAAGAATSSNAASNASNSSA
jgi:hypothetical protein